MREQAVYYLSSRDTSRLILKVTEKKFSTRGFDQQQCLHRLALIGSRILQSNLISESSQML